MGRDDNSMQAEEALTDDTVTLTATDEFCRNLGSIPTYGQSGNRMERLDELMARYTLYFISFAAVNCFVC